MKPGRCSKSGILTFINARLTPAGDVIPVSMRFKGDLAMDPMSVAALIVVAIVVIAAGVYIMKPESK